MNTLVISCRFLETSSIWKEISSLHDDAKMYLSPFLQFRTLVILITLLKWYIVELDSYLKSLKHIINGLCIYTTFTHSSIPTPKNVIELWKPLSVSCKVFFVNFPVWRLQEFIELEASWSISKFILIISAFDLVECCSLLLPKYVLLSFQCRCRFLKI